MRGLFARRGRHARLTPVRAIIARGALVAVLTGCTGAPAFEGTAIDPPRAMPVFRVPHADGSTVSLGAEAGRPLVLFFGYTNCPDICPTTLADWRRVKDQLGERARAVRFVFLSVDPERDTPEIAAAYARRFDASFMGVSPGGALIGELMQAFGVAAMPGASAEHLVSHSSQAYLLDAEGRLVALYPTGTPWTALAHDLDALL